MDNGLYSIKGGLDFDVKYRQYGNQDKGISPEGAQDQAAFLTAYYMLGQPNCFDCSELIYPGKITFNDDVHFILTGSPHACVNMTDCSNISQRIQHACVYEAKKGSGLVLKDREVGFRALLMAIKISNKNKSRAGLLRGEFHQYFPYWRELNKPIRVFEGSEYHILNDNTFLTSEWQLDKQSNQMGIRLLGNLIPHQKLQMISQPVSDGIIQLSPNGPIVLMRHRQTTGGYPRIACIAEVDIDRLAQIPLGSRITFEKISFDEAMKLKRLQSEAIEKLESDFG